MKKIVIDKQRLGENIRSVRVSNQLSEREFADRIGVASASRIRKWESGESLPSVINLINICNSFGVSFDVLIDSAYYL